MAFTQSIFYDSYDQDNNTVEYNEYKPASATRRDLLAPPVHGEMGSALQQGLVTLVLAIPIYALSQNVSKLEN